MALTGVSNKKFYSVLLSWDTGVALKKNEHYKISKTVPGVASVAEPDPAPVTKTLIFTVMKDLNINMRDLEAMYPSDGYDSMGITYDRISKYLVTVPEYVVYHESESEFSPDTALDLSVPEEYGDAAKWDFLNAFSMASIFNVRWTWFSVGQENSWPVLAGQSITDITALLADANAIFEGDSPTTTACEAAEKRFKEKATQVINNQ